MKENFIKLSYDLVFGLVVVAAVATTLFFLPTTSEFFEFNKLTALLVITILGLVIWAVRMVLEKRAVFTRTPLDVPILILAAVFFVSALASIDQFASFFGAHGRLWPSLFPLLSTLAFYFLTVSNLKTKKQVSVILWALILATAVASIIAISSYFALYFPADFAKLRSFNPLGVVNRLALLQALIIPIGVLTAVFAKDKVAQVAATVATLIITLSFILINALPAYVPLIAALIFAALGSLRTKFDKNQQGTLAVLAVFAALFLVLRFVPQVARGTLYAWIAVKDPTLTEEQQIDTPKEKSPSLQAAWDISASALGKKPLFGTGPGTYQFIYTQLKPRYVNGTDDWAIRFDKSSSDFTELVATTGAFGLLGYLIFVIAVGRFAWLLIAKGEHPQTYLPLSAAILGYLVATFFTVSSFSTFASFVLGAALLAILAKTNDEPQVFDVTVELAALKNRFAWFPIGGEPPLKTEPGARGAKSQLLPAIFLVVVVAFSFFALAYQVAAYRADYFYRQALLAARANDGNRTVAFLQKAIATNGRVDTYHQSLSQTALNAAISLASRGNLTDDGRQLLAQLAQVAIDQGKVASGYQILPLRLPGISAPDVSNWETLSAAYQALIGSVGGADVHATNTLAQAVALDPQNPILHDRLGQLYQRLGNLDVAQRKYEDAIIVKGDFGPAHYHLAKLLIDRKGEVARIVNELTLAKRLLPTDDPAREDIDKNLETYNKELQQLQQQTQTPQAGPSPSPGASPRPSPTPTPSASPSPSPSF